MSKELEPAKVNVRLVIALGTLIWFIALLILAAFYQPLADAGLSWWLHTAIVGVALGGVAFLIVKT